MKKRKKHVKIRYVIFSILGIMAVVVFVFTHFGGFGTGKTVNVDEFAEYAQSVQEISIPKDKRIVALGEATHGNKEFQQLKLEVFKKLVEQYGVRAFALEGDFGGCEQVNQYIHGGEGTAQEAAAKIGFRIYQTDEMIDLISYMREYNAQASEGDDLRFYGFDMQRILYSFQSLKKECENLGVDTTKLNELVDGDKLNATLDFDSQSKILSQLKNDLEKKQANEYAIHYADMLLQYCECKTMTESAGADLRDKFMASNVEWILNQEEQRGYERIFVAAHNMHVAKWGSYDSMGKILSKNEENGYYVVGTDFYKTRCNLPTRSVSKRTVQTFYSHDPLAKAAKLAGFDVCWLDFSKVPNDTELSEYATDYNYMGKLGESYSIIMRLIPPSYRMFQQSAVLYDSMIFVSDASPIEISKHP